MRTHQRLLLLFLGAFVAPVAAQEGASETYTLESSVMTMGGGTSESESYSLTDSMGLAAGGGEAASETFQAEFGLITILDADGDGISGANDLCPSQYAGCSDADGDGCVDSPDPDPDGDGVTTGSCDCNSVDGTVWGRPGEVTGLLLFHSGEPGTTVSWSPPVEPGGAAPRYDVIRSGDPADFSGGATCVEADDASDTGALDPADPSPGGVFYYLVRAENTCAAGPLGISEGFLARMARDC